MFQIDETVVVGALGGNITHEFGALDAAYQYAIADHQRRLTEAIAKPLSTSTSSLSAESAQDAVHLSSPLTTCPIALVSDNNVVVVVIDSLTSVTLSALDFNVRCGVLPFGGSRPRVTTRGLRWNLCTH